MDENTLRGKQENERKQVSKLLIINHDWYDVIKAGYYSRFHIYESIKQHYDDLDFELLIKYCIGEGSRHFHRVCHDGFRPTWCLSEY